MRGAPVAVRIERDKVREMFSDIAPTYDRLNRLLSFGVDRLWRRAAIRALLDGLPAPESARVLDLATGTGDVALGIRRRMSEFPGARVMGADIAFPMLVLARRKSKASLAFLQADALRLPFADASFDGLTIAFGLRNLEDRRKGLAEMARILRPGGRLVVLEFGRPRGWFGLVYHVYFRYVLPFCGRLISGHPTAYEYLPSTVYQFPDPESLSAMMRESGFGRVASRPLTGGIVQLHIGDRAF